MNVNTQGQHDREVGVYFDGAASGFDTFYDHQRSGFMQWVDRKFRSDMFERFNLTFEALAPLTDQTVLDVGCGSGPYVVEAVRRGSPRVVGLDMAEGMLELARRRAEQAGVAQACTFCLGTFPQDAPQEVFDDAIVMGVLDYVPDPSSFLSALASRVKRRAVLSFPSKHWFRTPLRKLRYWIKRCPVYFFDRAQIERLMADAGFVEVRVVKIAGAGMDYVATGSPAEAAIG
jgi:ubiquinone/menaquinone biosynthesis C-methylase UbiE